MAPPGDLTEAQRLEWLAIVNARPADVFGREHVPVLKQFCRHKVNADIVAEQIARFDPEWLNDEDGLKRYEKLCAMQERETRMLAALARSMRMTHQAVYARDAGKVRSEGGRRKPWQVAD